jgi:branched-chain amino acid transport system ATP-binding protein
MPAQKILEVQNVSVDFGGVKALKNVEISVNRYERVGLIGPNGSGKTTLFNVISGLVAHRGKIFFEGKDITKLNPSERARLGIARTFQIPRPFTTMSILENVTIPLLFVHKYSIAEAKKIAFDILQLTGLESYAHAFPAQLTQIQLRKLELSRALALRPKLLLLDEVGSGLTPDEVDELVDLLKQISKERGLTVIMVEHIMRAVFSFCERVIVLNCGEKIAEGTPKEIASHEEVVRIYLGQ